MMTTLRVPPAVNIGHVIRDAVVFDFKNWRGDAVDPDSLIQTVERLFAVLRERLIEYVLVGGVALPSLYRQANFARVGIYENYIATLLHDYHPPLAPLSDELAQLLNDSDLAAVREVVADIEQRLKRYGSGRAGP